MVQLGRLMVYRGFGKEAVRFRTASASHPELQTGLLSSRCREGKDLKEGGKEEE